MTTNGTVTTRQAHRSGHDGACIEGAAWRKATRSGQHGNCVEIKAAGPAVLIRDSKYLRNHDNDPQLQPIIEITTAQWQEFLGAVTHRSPGGTEPHITAHPDGSATLTATTGTTLKFTPGEWNAFTLAAIDGEFNNLGNGSWSEPAALVTA